MSPNVWQTADTANHCSICQKRSTWDFLQDFYTSVNSAHQFARKLEIDLQDARFGSQHFQRAFADCQAHLAACRSELDEERLSHGEARKDLELERENHKETERLFELAFSVAQQSENIVKDLRGEITQLECHTISDISNSSADLQSQLQYAKQQVKYLEALLSQTQVDQQTNLRVDSLLNMNPHAISS